MCTTRAGCSLSSPQICPSPSVAPLCARSMTSIVPIAWTSLATGFRLAWANGRKRNMEEKQGFYGHPFPPPLPPTPCLAVVFGVGGQRSSHPAPLNPPPPPPGLYLIPMLGNSCPCCSSLGCPASLLGSFTTNHTSINRPFINLILVKHFACAICSLPRYSWKHHTSKKLDMHIRNV